MVNRLVSRIITTNRCKLICSIGVLSVCLFGNSAFAQSMLLEEVIVTAQKREQSIQDVPIAITAFSGNQLQDLGIVNTTDLARWAPGVSVSGPGGGDQQQFSIRGATQNDFADQTEAPNALYVDEVYQAAQQAQLFASYDMHRVEILKGPQGTLFGRNATGGLVHFITNKPTQEFDAFADVTYGSYDQIRTEGAVGGALSETVSARVSGVFSSHDAILDNSFTNADMPAVPGALAFYGRPAFDVDQSQLADPWEEETWSVRGQLLFEPNEDFDFLVRTQVAKSQFAGPAYQHVPTVAFLDDTDGDGLIDDTVNAGFQSDLNTLCESININTGGCVNSIFDADFDTVRPNTSGDFYGDFDADGPGKNVSQDHVPSKANDIELWSVSGTATWDLDFAKLVSVSAYSSMKQYQSLDVGSAPVPRSNFIRQYENEWYTQELRLEGEEDDFNWIFGLYYMNVDVKSAQGLEDKIGGLNTFGGLFFGPVLNGGLNLFTGEFGAGVGGDSFLEATTDVNLETDSYSVFGQIDYNLTDQWSVNVGLRLILEEKDYSFTNQVYVNARDGRTDGAAFAGAAPLAMIFTPTMPLNFLAPYADTTSDTLWSGKVQLNYAPTDDLLFYGGVNRGIKAGNFNAPLLTSLTQSEYSYKEEVLLSYEIGFKSTIWGGKGRLNGAAYYYDYKDYQAYQFVGTSGAVFNADAEYYGFELDLLANPVDNMDLWFGLSYIDAEVKNIEVADNLYRNVEPTYTPEVQFTGVGRYTFQNVLGGSVSLQVDGTWVDKAWANINNFDTHRLPSNWIGNARIDWNSADGHWKIGGFVKNFSDTDAQNSAFDLAAVDGADEHSFEKPRWFGVNVRYNY